MDTYSYVDADGNPASIRLLGHRILVRKARLPDTTFLVNGGKPTHAAKNPVFAPSVEAQLESLTKNYHQNICEVLAIGPEVGRWRNPTELKKRGLNGNFSFPAEVGDFVVLPEMGKTTVRGVTGSEFDFLIDEAELIALIKEEPIAYATT